MQNFGDNGTKRGLDRRSFLGVTGAVAVATMASGFSTPAAADQTTQAHVDGRRKLGSLEVSSVGLGVQNMSRSYETLVPYRPEMINIIRAAYRKNAAPGQIALAWLMAQKPWIVPIPGTTQMAHMIQNVGAASVAFSSDEIKELNASVSSIQVQGKRLPDGILALSGVEAPAKK